MTDHAALAADLLDNAAQQPSCEASALLLAEAQVHATLALTHEQRAANLIRYWSIVPDSEKAGNAVREYVTTTT